MANPNHFGHFSWDLSLYSLLKAFLKETLTPSNLALGVVSLSSGMTTGSAFLILCLPYLAPFSIYFPLSWLIYGLVFSITLLLCLFGFLANLRIFGQCQKDFFSFQWWTDIDTNTKRFWILFSLIACFVAGIQYGALNLETILQGFALCHIFASGIVWLSPFLYGLFLLTSWYNFSLLITSCYDLTEDWRIYVKAFQTIGQREHAQSDNHFQFSSGILVMIIAMLLATTSFILIEYQSALGFIALLHTHIQFGTSFKLSLVVLSMLGEVCFVNLTVLSAVYFWYEQNLDARSIPAIINGLGQGMLVLMSSLAIGHTFGNLIFGVTLAAASSVISYAAASKRLVEYVKQKESAEETTDDQPLTTTLIRQDNQIGAMQSLGHLNRHHREENNSMTPE